MNEKILAAVSLSNGDFPTLDAKLEDAAMWVEHAARQGADLVVLPEALNKYRGDGAGNPQSLGYREMAMDDWQASCAVLIETAKRCSVAVTVPVFTREGDHLTNSFFLVSKTGEVLGRYQKMYPTPAELEEGVQPGSPSLIEWEGLQVGGAICFDTLFPDVFKSQAQLGADLFLVCSLWPGGDDVNYWSLSLSCPMVLAYPAWSRVIDRMGKDVAGGGQRWETLRFGFGSPVVTAPVNFDAVVLYGNYNQERIVEIERAYGEKVRVRFDQQNVTFCLESRSDDLSVQDLVEEFDLLLRADYLADCERLVAEHRA